MNHRLALGAASTRAGATSATKPRLSRPTWAPSHQARPFRAPSDPVVPGNGERVRMSKFARTYARLAHVHAPCGMSHSGQASVGPGVAPTTVGDASALPRTAQPVTVVPLGYPAPATRAPETRTLRVAHDRETFGTPLVTGSYSTGALVDYEDGARRAWRTTCSLTDPRSTRLRPVRPCEPTMITSAGSSSAMRQTVVATIAELDPPVDLATGQRGGRASELRRLLPSPPPPTASLALRPSRPSLRTRLRRRRAPR